MTWIGGYSLDLYCDNWTSERKNATVDSPDGIHTWYEFPHQYTDELGSVCRARARQAGWVLRSDHTAICPKCSGKKGVKK